VEAVKQMCVPWENHIVCKTRFLVEQEPLHRDWSGNTYLYIPVRKVYNSKMSEFN